jgi:hypothetical protein
MVTGATSTPLRADDAPAAETTRATARRLLVLDVRSGDLTAEQRATLTSFLAARAARFEHARVVSSADVRELAALQGEKQAAGCDDDGACLAEIAGALDAQLVLTTRAGKIGGTWIATLQLFSMPGAIGSPAGVDAGPARATIEARTPDDLHVRLGRALDDLLVAALGEARRAAPPDDPAPGGVAGLPSLPSGARPALQIGGGSAIVVGVAAVVLGAVPGVLYAQKKDALSDRTRRFGGSEQEQRDQLDAAARVHDEAIALRDQHNGVGLAGLWIGGTLVALGAAALAAGLVLPVATEEGP